MRRRNTIDGARWRAWAAALLSRRRRVAARIAGHSAVLAKPRAAVRTLRERWLLSSQSLRPQINLSIQPMLRFDFRPAPPTTRMFFHGTDRHTDTITDRSTDRRFVERFHSLAPLALVMQRLREPERGLALPSVHRDPEGPAARPEIARQLAGRVRRMERPVPAPAVRTVARDGAPAARNVSESAAPWDPEPPATASAVRAFPDRWHGTPAAGAAPAPPPAVNVEAVADRVMQQIDRRLHAWRERRGGF